MITRSEFLSMTGPNQMFALLNAIQGGFQQNVASTVIAAGTAYNLTNSAAALDFGTTDPVLSITSPGTYLLFFSALLEAAGATITTQTATLKLRRTNNTAADIANASVTVDIPVMTTLTQTIGSFGAGPTIYTTANGDDSLTIFGSLSASAGAGNITTSSARIVAVRLY